MHRAIAATLGAAVIFGAGTAAAQEFGSQGTFAITAERVFGLPWYEKTSLEWDNPPPEPRERRDWEDTQFGIGWGYHHTPYTNPRIGVDYFVIDGLSIGGAVGFASTSHDDDDPGNADDDHNMFILAPRVGYAIPFGRVAGFWPRGGFTFVTEGGDGPDPNELALTLEAMFWLAPAEGVAFLLGPTFDIGLFGSLDDRGPNQQDADLRRMVIGISVGLMGWL